MKFIYLIYHYLLYIIEAAIYRNQNLPRRKGEVLMRKTTLITLLVFVLGAFLTG
ncbi:MAG: hypothetical protein PHU78_01005 [Heliobacteriaceae bacterium]|nr:hypothetical protein [Heliobacteriaceae bacterium]